MKIVLLVIYLLAATFFGFMFGFADLGPGETATTRLLIATGYFLVTGGILGYVWPKQWLLSLMIAFSSIMTLIMSFTGGVEYMNASERAQGTLLNIVSIVAVVIVAYSAKLLKTKKV